MRFQSAIGKVFKKPFRSYFAWPPRLAGSVVCIPKGEMELGIACRGSCGIYRTVDI